MNRRKVLEGSRRQKALGKRSSVAALHPNTNGIAHPKSSEPPPLEKGIQHGNAESCKINPEAPEIHPKPLAPKTKFTSNDRSSEFSPRLKSFPAEELRRFDASPRVETTLAPFQMIGDGDIAPQPNKLVPQSRSMQNHSSHPEVFNVVPLKRSPERQPHRPCVPRPVTHDERLITEHQSEGNFLKTKEPDEMESQPVGGRTAAVFRQQISGPHQNLQAAAISEDRLNHKQHQQHRNHVQFADDSQEISHEMYLHNYPQQFFQYPQQFPGLGMTSPQDVSMNQSRMYQQHVYPQQGGGPWLQYPGYQFSNPSPAHHQQQVPQQPDQGEAPSLQQYPNNINYPLAPQHHHQRHQQTVQPPQQREYPRQRDPEDKNPRKVLEFTPEMIRDQEKLVQILRQQGFPDEIMKRQFDGLLAEQQRQLMFLHQLENPDDNPRASKNTEQPRRRRITRVDEDEKPEWMMHITPPWVSYASLEQRETNEQKREQDQQNPQEQEQNMQQQMQQQDLQQQNLQQLIQQSVNPGVYQQLQEQRMMIPNAHLPAQYHHHHTQQVPNHPSYQYYQNSPKLSLQQQQTFQPQNNQELISQDRKARVEPSSLLKLKIYKDVVKRQRQNNGLQDAATVKEAMEALRNPVTRKRLEYLANLEKKEKQIKLNGIQDPEESLLQNWPHRPPDYVLQQLKREARANGLENKRNPDNPRPPVPIFERNGSESMPVYPGRVEGDQQFYSMHPSLGNDGIHQNCASALRNVGDPSQGYKNNFQAHVNNQVQGGTSGSQQCLNVGRSSSVPFDMYSQQRQEYFQETPKSCLRGGQGDGNGHGQIQGQCYVRRFFEEPRVIGGVKYIGRKPEFIPNSCSPGQY
ncbi:uncharacterized protein LOC107039436 [Diachasma alloeum]|uniref:uncharacterized protein LOC107039436 n=1 Tax=Diachasma alloeum TaxID=454923 RepID=UPI0007381846|nr:uncharacterized protein LOC107039436 [Diachasma alloeum]